VAGRGGARLTMDQAKHWQEPADPLANNDVPSIAEIRRDLKKIPPVRLAATFLLLLIALIVARYSWQLPVSWTEDGGRTVLHFPVHRGEDRLTIPLSLDAERAL
jgi:hypothetical protein